MKRYMSLALVALLAIFAAQAGATNLLVNGSFQSGDFSGWTIGNTSNGTWGQGFPLVTAWPFGGMNAAQGEVGEVSFDGTYQGGTLSQTFYGGGGDTSTLSFDWAAMGDGQTNHEGGLFELLLDGTVLAQHDVGAIGPDQLVSGTLSANFQLSVGTHTFEIAVLRPYLSIYQNTPFQYVTNADVEGIAEPGSLILMGSGVLGLAGVLRRKIGF